MNNQSKNRVLIFCVSEMAPDLVRKWSSDLPTFSRLAHTGVSGHTRYCVPYYLTPQMWATINTGTMPGTHGVFDYRQRTTDGTFQETNGGDVLSPCWWHSLEQAGRRVGVVNLPLTFPPRISSGFMISGQDAPGGHPSIMTPTKIFSDLESEFGRYHLKDVFPGGQDRQAYAALLESEIKRQSSVFEWIATNQQWDCLLLYTSGAAMAQHYYWSDMEKDADCGDVIKNTFMATDRMLGRIIEAIDDKNLNVCVVSECGAGPIASGINLNAALKKAGLLAFLGENEMRVAGRKFERKLLSSVRSTAQRYLPKNLYYAANRSFLRKWILGRLATQGIDWSRTHAFHRGKGEGNIYLNIKGRDIHGIVDPSERNILIEQIINALSDLRAPDGRNPISAIHKREDLYNGPCIEAAPDIIIEWHDCAYMPSERDHENEPLFGERWREYMSWPTSGSHRPEGVFIAAGPNIITKSSIETVRLVDLAPLWLAMNGVECPMHMEGSLRQDILVH